MIAISDNVIVKEIKQEERISKGGLIIPSTVKEEPQKLGRVLGVGPKVEGIKIGDIVVFAKFGGQAFILENEDYMALKQPEIYCVIEEESGFNA
jgi:chaperonin GroES